MWIIIAYNRTKSFATLWNTLSLYISKRLTGQYDPPVPKSAFDKELFSSYNHGERNWMSSVYLEPILLVQQAPKSHFRYLERNESTPTTRLLPQPTHIHTHAHTRETVFLVFNIDLVFEFLTWVHAATFTNDLVSWYKDKCAATEYTAALSKHYTIRMHDQNNGVLLSTKSRHHLLCCLCPRTWKHAIQNGYNNK